MSEVHKAEVLDVCPSPYGYAMFIKAKGKIFLIYVDRARGVALQSALLGEKSDRPLSSEFMLNLLDGLESSVKRVLIYHVNDGVFFTKMTVSMDNELGSKIVEVDGRPSDTIAIALRIKAPIFVSDSVLNSVADVSDAYNKIRGMGNA